MSRSRNWCFTVNNYEEKDIAQMEHIKGEFIFQEEIGEQGTPHLQGFVKFPNALTLKGVRKIHNKAHWEKAKGTIFQNISYCTKEESNNGKIYSNMDWKKIMEKAPGIKKDSKKELNIKKNSELLKRHIMSMMSSITCELMDKGYAVEDMSDDERLSVWYKELNNDDKDLEWESLDEEEYKSE